MEKTKRFCPCCSFDLDLFLPDSEKHETTRVDDLNENENDSISLSPLPDITRTLKDLMGNSGIEGEDQKDEPNLPVVIVDTHGHAQLDRKRDETYSLQALTNQKTKMGQLNRNFVVKSLACSVEPADFDATLKYAATSDSILPALGVHPWYIGSIPGYSSTLAINSSKNNNDPMKIEFDCVDSEWLVPMEELLLEHPNCLVGEIGLCKIAKWVRTHPDGKAAAMEIQKRIFKKQMMLTARLGRPVSVHCVNSHGIFIASINELLERKVNEEDVRAIKNNESSCSGDASRRSLLPPAIGMHSFTGTAHHVKELLDLEHRIDFPNDNSRATRKKKKASKNRKTTENDDAISSPQSPRPPLFYFGFSHAVNYAMCTSEKSRKKGKEAVQAVPLNRLLVESDVHSDLDVAGGTVGAISYVTWARKMQARDVMSATSKNGSAFLGSIRF
jgi:Tat protein secretion system quality control protein TatD with DNase activity